MYRTATEQLNTQLNADAYTQPTYSASETETKQINEEFLPGTSIFIRGNDKTGYFATIGQYKITETYQDLKNLKYILNHPQLDLITRITSVMIEASHKIFKESNDSDQNNTSIQS